MRSTLVLALVFLWGPTLAAQTAKPEAKAPALETAKPGPEMAKLKSLVGTWRVENVHEPGFMGPGGKGSGSGHLWLGPGGLSLLIDYSCLAGFGKGFRGHGILAWDGEAKAYKQAWTDNMAPMVMVSTGNWTGESLVLNTEGSMMGKPFKSRDTYVWSGPDSFVVTTEMSLEGGPMSKIMTLSHTRLKEAVKK
jgi:hypothetical protein